MAVRPVRALERQGLLSLWETVFGDGGGFVNSFLDGTGVEIGGFAAVENGVTAAAAYTVGGISVGGVPYPYIYAVSTLPEFRGHGLGAEVSEACAAEAESRGGVPALHPVNSNVAGIVFLGLYKSLKNFTRSSGTVTIPTFGSIVANG